MRRATKLRAHFNGRRKHIVPIVIKNAKDHPVATLGLVTLGLGIASGILYINMRK